MPNAVLVRAADISEAAGVNHDLSKLFRRPRFSGLLNTEYWVDVANPRRIVIISDMESLDLLQYPSNRAAMDSVIIEGPPVDKALVYCEGEQMSPGDHPIPSGAGGLLLAALDIPPEVEEEFNEWYDTQHIPVQSALPTTICARRFRSKVGTQRYVTLYHLTSPDAVDSPEWKNGQNLTQSPKWRPYYRNHVRILARPIKDWK